MGSHLDRAKHRHHDHALWNQAEWNHIVRGETEFESIERQFTELLQELRVAQTGVQILFAFLLGGWPSPPGSPTSAAPSRGSI